MPTHEEKAGFAFRHEITTKQVHHAILLTLTTFLSGWSWTKRGTTRNRCVGAEEEQCHPFAPELSVDQDTAYASTCTHGGKTRLPLGVGTCKTNAPDRLQAGGAVEKRTSRGVIPITQV